MKRKMVSAVTLTLLLISMLMLAIAIQPVKTEPSRVTAPDDYVATRETTNMAGQGSPPLEWNKTYGGTNYDVAEALVQTIDGGYALAGSTYSFGAGNDDFWLVKTDANGTMQWNRTYGGTGRDIALALVQTGDNGYAIAGYTSSFGAGSYDFWLIKTDTNGTMQWNKTYGGIDSDAAYALIQTSDGGYAIAGLTRSFGAGYTDFWLVKTDANGTMQWNKTYGGTNYDWAFALVQTTDGGYAIAGRTESSGAGSCDVWLVKTYANGTIGWNKTYGGTNWDEPRALMQTSDEGYALAGSTNSFGSGDSDSWLVKTYANGNVQWSKTYGGTNSDETFALVQTSDGGYALAGMTMSFGASSGDSWLVKTDAIGNAQWNKTYGGTNWDYANALVQTVDGGYALAGFTGSFGAGSYDFWLVKTAPESRRTWIVDDDGPADFHTIQEAVNAANSGDTIIVKAGTYIENVKINKANLTITSESGAEVTIVQAANPDDHVFAVSADHVTMIGLTVRGATGSGKAGIYLSGRDIDHEEYCDISHNIALNNALGIYLNYSSNNAINNNTCKSNQIGIYFWPYCENNIIRNNICNSNFQGICLAHHSDANILRDNICNSNDYDGIRIHSVSSNNRIENNDCNFNRVNGIAISSYSSSNTITGNNCSSNNFGIHPEWYSSNNMIYLNNIIDNVENANSTDSINTWNSPKQITYTYNGKTYTNYLGNYWTDYIGDDADGDGIGDAPYSIDSDKDNFPLMEPFENYIQPRYVIGVDVSEFQCGPPLINWSKVHDSGVGFAYVRATLGDNRPPALIDSNFTINMMNAKEAGLLVGAYHVAYADRNNAVDEAEFFLSVAGNYIKAGYLRPMLDLEQDILNNIMAEKGPEAGKLYLQSWVHVWASKVENETGQVPILYMGKYAAANYFNQSFRKYDLWIVDWTYNLTTPPSSIGIWEKWVFWQYSNNSHVDGITGFVDCDAFNGDINLLRNTVLIGETNIIDHVIEVAGEIFHVITQSNSTVSNLVLDQSQIKFNISGDSGAVGYCNVTIPKSLMNCTALDDWIVWVNGTQLFPPDLTTTENGTHTFLYFTCTFASLLEVTIKGTYVVPEFPSFLIMLLFMIATLLVITIYKRKQQP